MKIARLDNLPRQDSLFEDGEPDAHYEIRQIIIVVDGYDFGANDATDLTLATTDPERSTAIDNWDEYGSQRFGSITGFDDWEKLREEIKKITDAATWANLTTSAKEIASSCFTVDKTDRDSVHTVEEQEANAETLARAYLPDAPEREIIHLRDLIKDADKVDIDNHLSIYGIIPDQFLIVAMSDETTDIAVGDDKVTLHAPCAFYLFDIIASLTTVSSAGVVTIDIERNGTTIFTTLLTIDATEFTSSTAAAPLVMDAAERLVAKGDKLTFNIDADGTGAKGLKISLSVKLTG